MESIFCCTSAFILDEEANWGAWQHWRKAEKVKLIVLYHTFFSSNWSPDISRYHMKAINWGKWKLTHSFSKIPEASHTFNAHAASQDSITHSEERAMCPCPHTSLQTVFDRFCPWLGLACEIVGVWTCELPMIGQMLFYRWKREPKPVVLNSSLFKNS